MTNFVAIITALVTYLVNLISVIPAFVTQVKSNPDFTWMVTSSEVREVSFEEYYEFYQENYDPYKTGDIYDNPQNYPIPDFTEKYQALLDENLKIAQGWKKLPGKGQVEFFNAVKDNGPWDYKKSYPTLDWGPTYNGKFLVYGCVMDYETLGNINFAFTGGAVGFTPTVIRTGGGAVNIKNLHGDWEDLPYYWDEADDAAWITFGLDLYNFVDPSYYENAKTIDLFLGIVEPKLIFSLYKVYVDIYGA